MKKHILTSLLAWATLTLGAQRRIQLANAIEF